MRVCLFSKYGQSSNLLYEGVRIGLKESNVDFLDINISFEKIEEPPKWISIPTLEPSNPLNTKDNLIIERLASFKPDHIFVLTYSALQFLIDNGDTLRKIMGGDGKIIFWYVDLAPEINENVLLGKYIDFFFLSNAGQLDEYKKKWGLQNVHFMPQGCFIADSIDVNLSEKYDVGFLGRRQKEDPRYIERNRILDIFSDKFNLDEQNTSLNIKDAIRYFRNCKINLGLSWKNDIYLYSSDRIFNVLGACGFYLCSYFPGLERLFVNKTHLVWFKNEIEAVELAKYYLEHGRERANIKKNGYNICINKHTYTDRVKNILSIINGDEKEFNGFLNN